MKTTREQLKEYDERIQRMRIKQERLNGIKEKWGLQKFHIFCEMVRYGLVEYPEVTQKEDELAKTLHNHGWLESWDWYEGCAFGMGCSDEIDSLLLKFGEHQERLEKLPTKQHGGINNGTL